MAKLEKEKKYWISMNNSSISTKSKNNQNFYFYNIENINNDKARDLYYNKNKDANVNAKFNQRKSSIGNSNKEHLSIENISPLSNNDSKEAAKNTMKDSIDTNDLMRNALKSRN